MVHYIGAQKSVQAFQTVPKTACCKLQIEQFSLNVQYTYNSTHTEWTIRTFYNISKISNLISYCIYLIFIYLKRAIM
jgi:hypothetical protein